MKVLVGLGNPGKQYLETKHNFGFWVLDDFAKRCSLIFQAGKGEYLIAKKEKLLCIKPITYMNNSGIALLDVIQYYKVDAANILVIYDDIDLPLGKLRFRSEGGSGGHKGIESIVYHLKSEKFNRLRIGIATSDNMKPSEKFVLSPFNKNDEDLKKEMIIKACEGIEYYLERDLKKTMNKYN